MRLLRADVLLLFAALGLMSCASATTNPDHAGRVELQLSQTAYLSGDSVTIGVISLSDVQLTYPLGFCPRRLQRNAGGTWVDVTIAAPTGACPLAIALMAPRERQTIYFPLPVDLSSGVYRIVLPAAMVDISNPDPAEPSLLITQEFTVNSHPS
jgi:hypothetical protein